MENRSAACLYLIISTGLRILLSLLHMVWSRRSHGSPITCGRGSDALDHIFQKGCSRGGRLCCTTLNFLDGWSVSLFGDKCHAL